MNDDEPGPPEAERLAGEPEAAAPEEPADDWEPGAGVVENEPLKPSELEAHDAAVEIKELDRLDKLDWREYLETYSNNWQEAPQQDSGFSPAINIFNCPAISHQENICYCLPRTKRQTALA